MCGYVQSAAVEETVRYRTQVLWPVVVDDRLDALVAAAVSEGERCSRADMLAALVWHAPENGEGLGVTVRAYRRALRDVSTDSSASPKRRRPGPRPVALPS
jgi:hypothetical protein